MHGSDRQTQRCRLPGFFVRGTYHDFSNAKEIGWHPRYRDLLDE
ncbi:ABC-three component system protein [Pseudomonas poae]